MKLVAVPFLHMLLLAASVRLYLTDGTYHIVREYKVIEDRVRYYSVERSEWEEIPLELVDLKRTQRETVEKQQALSAEQKALAEEEKAEREAAREAARVPEDTGAYWAPGDGDVVPLKQSEVKVVTNKGRSVLKAITPIPIITGKATAEIDGLSSGVEVRSDRPDFYIRLSGEERFGIVKLSVLKASRVVQKWTIVPVTKEIVEEMNTIEVFRKQVAEGLYRIWPSKPLEAGEYAVIEYTEGKGNVQVWDFTILTGTGKANP